VGVGFNRDYWARFEKFVKDVVRQSDGVYIVTGPLYLPTPEADPASGRTGWRMQYPLIGAARVRWREGWWGHAWEGWCRHA
jgi:DNA/RNA endonuclease G (NUC1)